MISTRILTSTVAITISFLGACGDDNDGDSGTDGNVAAGAGGEGGDPGSSLGGAPATGGKAGSGEGGSELGQGGEPTSMGGAGGAPTCVEGETRCNGDTVEECLPSGEYSPIEECEEQCLEGECVGECDPGATQCIDEASYECDDDGNWQIVEECAPECDCPTGAGGAGGGGSGTGGKSGSGTGGKSGNPGDPDDCETPDIVSATDQIFDTEASSHEVDLPATEEGDLLIVLLSTDGRASVTTPAGWTALYTRSVPFDVNDGLTGSAFARVAEDAGESTVDFVTSFEEQAAAQVYRIGDGTWFGQLGLGVSANSTDHAGSTGNVTDPPELDLSMDGWGDGPVLWIAAGHTGCCANSSELIDGPAVPMGYGSAFYTESGVGNEVAPLVPQWAQITSALRVLSTESQDPSPFSGFGNVASGTQGSTFRVAGTIAVRPSCR